MLRGWSGVCVSHGNSEKQRGAGGITDFHLSAWAARAALGWTRLQRPAPPAPRPRPRWAPGHPRPGDRPRGGVWGSQRGLACGEDLQPGAAGCQHPPVPLRVALGEQSKMLSCCEQRHPPVPRPLSRPRPQPATLGHVQGAACRREGRDLIRTIPWPGTRAPAQHPGAALDQQI